MSQTKPAPIAKPAHVRAWEALEPKRKPAWKPSADSRIRFPVPSAPISAEQFRKDLTTIGLNQSAFARWIGREGRTVRYWASGRLPVPLEIGFLLTLLKASGAKPEDINQKETAMNHWIIENETDRGLVWGADGWTDALTDAIRYSKNDLSNLRLPLEGRWKAI